MLDLKPSSILVFVFVALLLKTIVNAIGKAKIESYVWNLYINVASKSEFVELKQKREQLIEINKQRKSISAQDEYAKWTKLNRQFDKVNSEVAALTEAVSSEKLKLTKAIGVAISLCTAAPIWFSRVWYRKAILFYFPQGVLPHYLEWVLALPFITTGGVGLTIWMMAVNWVLGGIAQIVLFYLSPLVPKPVAQPESNAARQKKE
uniref:Golgi to ER traffic protein 1 n=1 Tax=Candidozyma auris TaxID=498019 RepID=A0A0L0NVX7_CANAR